ncbi:AAA family ATPase [Corynebacterium glucuronolyticum]|nr:AAA family ATPase [Corynebacterium glucuronolyticum]QRO81840.1 AAA family ATPase [Corynebacterium glucuronolyticum]
MSYDLLHRNTKSIAEEILSDTPVLSVSGARQVGKSTLASQLLLDRPSRFVNLDETSHLTSAREDPDGFVRMFPEGTLAIDEIQRAPELFRAIKGALEEDRRPGRFIITGSSNLLMGRKRQRTHQNVPNRRRSPRLVLPSPSRPSRGNMDHQRQA